MALCCSQLLGWRDLIKGGTCLKNVRTTGLKKNICKKKKINNISRAPNTIWPHETP